MSRDCATCLKNGHRCAAIDIDYAPGDVALCAFCEDGVPCPVMKRQRDPVLRDRPQHKPTLKNDVLRSGIAKAKQSAVEATRVNEFGTRKETEMGTHAKTVKCKKDGCTTMVTANCKSGYCGSHFYLSKGNRIAGGANGKAA